MRLGPAEVRFTSRADGDLGHAGVWVAVEDVVPAVEARRRAVVDRPWSWLRQVHGGRVVTVAAPGDQVGVEADGAVSAHPDAALCVLTADCAPLALASPEGIIGVAHAGWRGLVEGIVERTVTAMRTLGAGEIDVALGPCIHAECYEFSAADLDAVAGRLGDGVRGRTAAGAPALDVPAAVGAAVTQAGARLVHDAGVCTACSPNHWSHRARGELERQAVVVWLP